jgi:LysM repeat protein
LGSHRKPPRIRLPQATAGAAGPTLAGVAAAICLSPQAPAAASVAPSASAHHATVPQAFQRGPTPAQLLAVAKHAAASKTGSDLPTSYTVRPGDTLSSIAKREYHNSSAWPVLYWRNHAQVRWANIITAGQKLRVPKEPAHVPAPPKQLAPAPVHTASHYQPRHARTARVTVHGSYGHPYRCGDGDGDGYDMPCWKLHQDQAPADPAPAPAAQPAAPAAQPAASGAGLSGVWACIAQHESGGNPATNTGNGFYGAFQFTLASWQAVGGPPGLPSNYPLSVQLHYAEVLQARSGWGNWPVTSQMCGV